MTIKKHYLFSITIIVQICCSLTLGQIRNTGITEIGQPFVKYFSNKEYKASTENWSIIQDRRGVMYFGNASGVLEYDGNSWRKIKVPFSASVRSLAVDSTGTIYVCASADFGYLKPDSLGQLQFTSLMPHLDKKYRNFGEMWDVSASSKAVFFKTKDKIFRWNGNDFHVWDSVSAYRLYNVNDTIYARNSGVGLMMIDGDSINLIPDGEFFADIGVYDMLPFDDNGTLQKGKVLVTTNREGLFISDGKKFTRFSTDADSFLFKSQIYNSCITADGNFAFATQRGGVVLIDRNGKLIRIINENSDLQTNVVYDVFSDQHGGLWFSTALGIVYCEALSPFTLFQDKGYLRNLSSSVLRFNNKIYVTNEFGVLYFSNKTSTFQLVEGSNKPAYTLLNANGTLLAGTNWGVVRIENEKLKETIIDNSTEVMINSTIHSNRIYVGQDFGLAVIQKQNSKHLVINYDGITPENVLQIVEESDSSLWLAGYFPGITHITRDLRELPQRLEKDVDYKYYEKKNGLPGGNYEIYNIQNRMLLTSSKGVFKFDNISGRFIPDSILGKEFTDSTNSISRIIKNENGDLWILAEINGVETLGKAELQSNGKYKWKPDPLFYRLGLSSVRAIYSDFYKGKEILWISTEDALVRYDPTVRKDLVQDFSTLIRKVIVTNDSLIYGGFKHANTSMKEVILPSTKNDIRFELSSTSFDRSEATQYQYYLEGEDENWSQWTSENKIFYSNLSGGSYKFHVRAKNVYGIIGKEDVYSFKVLPPWYFTWWAFAMYALLIITGIFITDRIMRRRLITRERNKARLREAELIKRQAEELETVDRLVRVINSAEDLDKLFDSLLEQTISFIPQAEKAAVFLLDHNDDLFHVAFTSGYQVNDLEKIVFSPDELKKRYSQNSEEIEKGIYIISNTDRLFGDEKLIGFHKAKSMLIMAVEWDGTLEAYVVFDSFADKNAFSPSTARILNRFREHAVSAISKAQSLKTLQEKNEEIIKAQEKLITQEKLASLGALTAGIAHEIKNPLNFVNNFAELTSELLDELKEKFDTEKNILPADKFLEIEELINTLQDNTKKINAHGSRADSIVKGMLLHSRGASGEKVPTNLNELLDQYVSLAYHGLRAQDKEFNITIEKDYDNTITDIDIIPQDISRVFLNIINNACYAANEKKRKSGRNFVPVLKVSTKKLQDKVEIRIRDNGNGIPSSVKEHIFNPFFTTKPSGEGTGLGLSLSYEIITKEHGGEIKVETKEGEFTEFIVLIPFS